MGIISKDFSVGRIAVKAENDIVTGIFATDIIYNDRDATAKKAIDELTEYFEGKRCKFDFRFSYAFGTSFQHKVWDALHDISYGNTESYGSLALKIGCPAGARAIGNAAHINPLLILIPCHRLIKSDGTVGGFALGSETKIKLLEIEKNNKEKFI